MQKKMELKSNSLVPFKGHIGIHRGFAQIVENHTERQMENTAGAGQCIYVYMYICIYVYIEQFTLIISRNGITKIMFRFIWGVPNAISVHTTYSRTMILVIDKP